MAEPDPPPSYEPYRPTRPEDSREAPDNTGPADVPYSGPSRWLPEPPEVSDNGYEVRATRVDPDRVARLAPGPRPVPLAYRLAVLNVGPIGLVVILVAAVSPLALWILVPGALAVAAWVGVALATTRAFLLYTALVPILRWGEVATVTGAEVRTTSTSYTNMPLRNAVGWTAKRQMYTGVGHRSEITYRLGAEEGRLVLRGLAYSGGVVLAHPRVRNRAICVSQLGFDATPDAEGRYPGTLPVWSWIGIAVTMLVHVGLVVVAVAS